MDEHLNCRAYASAQVLPIKEYLTQKTARVPEACASNFLHRLELWQGAGWERATVAAEREKFVITVL